MAEYLISTTHHLLLLSEGHRFAAVHSGIGLYYGLAKSKGRIYVGCQHSSEKAGSVLVFDEKTLKQTGVLKPEFPLIDVHGIACFDDKLWVTCCFDNLVAVYDFKTRAWAKWYPSKDLHARDVDVNHYNTICAIDGHRICVTAHNLGASELQFYDRRTLELIEVQPLGRFAHDFFWHKGRYGLCSSGEGALLDSGGWALRTGGFPRGIAFGPDSILLGLSTVSERGDRSRCSGVVRRYDRRWRTLGEYVLPNVGMVLAILPISGGNRMYRHLEPWPHAKALPKAENDVIPNNLYEVGEGARSWLRLSEWHEAEGEWRWTAARDAGLEVIINPGDKRITVMAANNAHGAAKAEVLLCGKRVGEIVWSTPGILRRSFRIPRGRVGRCALYFRVSRLWRPSRSIEFSTDERLLGICVQSIAIT